MIVCIFKTGMLTRKPNDAAVNALLHMSFQQNSWFECIHIN